MTKYASKTEITELVDKLEAGIRCGEYAFFFDMDKTLAADAPGTHKGLPLNQKLSEIFTFLANATGGAVSINTGRPDLYLKTVVPYFVGVRATENGAIIRRGHTDIFNDMPQDFKAFQEFVDSVVQDYLEDIVSHRHPGIKPQNCYLEDGKEATLTVQFTEVADYKKAKAFGDKLFEKLNEALALSQFAESYKFKHGTVKNNAYIEVLGKKVDKGTTVTRIMKLDEFKGRTPIFFGDNDPDGDGMEIAREMGGFGVGVTEFAPIEGNEIRLKDYKQTIKVLEQLKERFEKKPMTLTPA